MFFCGRGMCLLRFCVGLFCSRQLASSRHCFLLVFFCYTSLDIAFVKSRISCLDIFFMLLRGSIACRLVSALRSFTSIYATIGEIL